MARPGRIREIETEQGKPILDIVLPLYEQVGSQKKVAEILKTTQGTISLVLKRHELTVTARRRIVSRQPQPESA